ncbi:MAG: ThiF family adenylyltransferase [Bacteroidota bacterium]
MADSFDPTRYARQLSLDIIGPAGQQQLTDSRVAVVGCGGLGAIAAAYLAGAGVGYLRLIDGDAPDLSNLHRQVFFSTQTKATKAEALAKRLADLNPDLTFAAVPAYLSRKNAAEHLTGVDLVLECTDQAFIKHLVSDYCALEEIPLIYGAVHKTQGYLALFANQTNDDCHLRDLFPAPDDRLPTCAEVGVLNTAAGLIGLLQANEALKYLLGVGTSLRNKLLTYDCLSHHQHIIKISKNFQQDIEDIWETTHYGHQDNWAPEISWDELQQWPSAEYQLFSLLPPAQEEEMLPNALRYSSGQLQSPGKKVFYCPFGRQSLAVAKQLRAQGIEAYSLKGGRNGRDKTLDTRHKT